VIFSAGIYKPSLEAFENKSHHICPVFLLESNFLLESEFWENKLFSHVW
jgi:hypothetical protein